MYESPLSHSAAELPRVCCYGPDGENSQSLSIKHAFSRIASNGVVIVVFLGHMKPPNRHPIPVNLYVANVAATKATVGWELPNEYLTGLANLRGYQVRFYELGADYLSEEGLVNVTGAETSTALLRNLRPETRYEFSVRAVPYAPAGLKGILVDTWSMVEGFETTGQCESSGFAFNKQTF